MNDFLFIILSAFLVFTEIRYMTRHRRWRAANEKEPVLTEHAKIHVKESTMSTSHRPAQYYLYLFIPDRDTVEQCEVAKSIYYYLEKGDWGTLTHQGEIFISFIRDSDGATIRAKNH